MKIKLIIGGALLVVALIFSIQHPGVLDVKFIAWKFTTSLALVIFATLAARRIGGWRVSSAMRLKGAGEMK